MLAQNKVLTAESPRTLRVDLARGWIKRKYTSASLV